MGKTPMVYHGNERSRHHSYSRNNQSRNRRSDNQEFGAASYIYSPDPYLRRSQPSRRGNRHVGRGSSQQFRERPFRNRPLPSNHNRAVQRLTPRVKHLRRNMHPPEESGATSSVTAQTTDKTQIENDSSESQKLGEAQSNESSVPQTRSSAKSQQNKLEETAGSSDKSGIEEGHTKDQSLQTRSTSKAPGKSEEPDKDEDDDRKISRITRGSSKARGKSEEPDKDEDDARKISRITRGSNIKTLSTEAEDITAKDQVTTAQARSPGKGQNKLEDSSMNKTRGNSKSVSDDKVSSSAAETHLEDKQAGHNTRSAAKTKQEADKTKQEEEKGHSPKPRKLRNETNISAIEVSAETKSNLEQSIELIDLVEADKTLEHESFVHEEQLNKESIISVSQETDTTQNKAGDAAECVSKCEKEFAGLSPSTKKLMGNKSPKLILSHVDTPIRKLKEFSPEKKETNSPIDGSDVLRRSSRRSSSKSKTEDSLLSYIRQRRGQSGTPLHFPQEIDQQERADTSAVSIRSISCRRPIRDSPISNLSDSFLKKKTILSHQAQLNVQKMNESLSSSKLDESAENKKDLSIVVIDSSPPKEKLGERMLTEPDSFPPKEKFGKRKSSEPETSQDRKKICTFKPEQASSVFSDVSLPLQGNKKQEVVSSSTPFKVVECFETIHMDVSEENISEYENTGDISEQSLSVETEAHVIKENIVNKSLEYEKMGDLSGQSTLESDTHMIETSNEQATRKWCSVM